MGLKNVWKVCREMELLSCEEEEEEEEEGGEILYMVVEVVVVASVVAEGRVAAPRSNKCASVAGIFKSVSSKLWEGEDF